MIMKTKTFKRSLSKLLNVLASFWSSKKYSTSVTIRSFNIIRVLVASNVQKRI